MPDYKVVDAQQLDEGLTAVADAIREKTGGAALLSFPEEMAAGVGAVFDAGRKNVFAQMESINFLFHIGYNKALFSDFLASDLSNVKLAQYVFENNNWIAEFDCPASLTPSLIHGMFRGCKTIARVSGLEHIATQVFTDLFMDCSALVDAGSLNFSGVGYVTRTFQGCTELKNIRFTGTVGVSVDLHWSPLTKASIESVIGALSAAASGMTVTLSQAAVNTAFETAEGAADGASSGEWLALTAEKSNWTISLV